jgi:hypothetical protein
MRTLGTDGIAGWHVTEMIYAPLAGGVDSARSYGIKNKCNVIDLGGPKIGVLQLDSQTGLDKHCLHGMLVHPYKVGL